QEADPAGTGICTYQAFLQVMFPAIATFHSADDLRDAFRSFDDKGVQFISAMDLRYILGAMGDKLSDIELNELMDEARAKGCVDTDGNLQYEDFINVLMPEFMKEA
ncbi:MAG: hypothetical protein Q8J97_02105, partial [Flavobacteriaceae bacterium]|nr:hypothetical protein [Flavobacteriaceae bacterium]